MHYVINQNWKLHTLHSYMGKLELIKSLYTYSMYSKVICLECHLDSHVDMSAYSYTVLPLSQKGK